MKLRCAAAAFAAVVVVACCLAAGSAAGARKQVTVVLLGATGSLAQKYLWQALFDLRVDLSKTDPSVQLVVIGAARDAADKGSATVNDILDQNVKCRGEPCDPIRNEFIEGVFYHRLKVDEDFQLLNEVIATTAADAGLEEAGRIFYFSVPPFAYAGLAKNVDKYCRPPKDAYLRVAIEKPFGSDLETAQEMASQLNNVLAEDELYRVDHYLGKRGVQQIAEFKHYNSDFWKATLQAHEIDRIEVVMKETEDCKGRTNFYDHYGVVRDTLQNHLTEVMALVGMEIPESPDRFHDLKSEFLIKMGPAMATNTLLGQYEKYNQHYREDHPGAEKRNTATFAAAVLKPKAGRFQGVPFVVLSGKQLDRREAYARIVFKHHDNVVCVNRGPDCEPREITFHIQGSHPAGAAVTLRGHWLGLKAPPNWTKHSIAVGEQELIPASTGPDAAYSKLVGDLFHGNSASFVNTNGLLLSWRIWTPLVKAIDLHKGDIRTYKTGGENLNFRLLHEASPQFLQPHTMPSMHEEL